VHCDYLSILFSDNSDGQEKTGRKKQRAGWTEEEGSTAGLVCQTAKKQILASHSRDYEVYYLLVCDAV
jgi:hypothetical protein